jgi:phosphatidylglycerophosphate synthase
MAKKKTKRRKKRRPALKFIDRLNKDSRRKREKFFRPILKDLKKMGITANMLSNLRIFLVLLFLPIFFYNKFAGALLMLFILFLDSLDGSLARYSKNASDRGKFIDISVDHLVYSIIAVTLLAFKVDVFYILATIKKQEFEESDWIIKPYPQLSYLKTLPVLAFLIASFLTLNPILINWALALPNLVATLLVIYYFIFIQIRWKFKR